MSINVHWTIEEIEACSDTIGGKYRFVSAKKNPNKKEFYKNFLYRKLRDLSKHESIKKWHSYGYKGFNKGTATIYIQCPDGQRSTLTYNAADHAPQKELNMKWINSCAHSNNEKTLADESKKNADTASASEINSHSYNYESSLSSVSTFGTCLTTSTTTCPFVQATCSNNQVADLFDETIYAVNKFLISVKNRFLKENTTIDKVFETREEIGFQLQSQFLNNFKMGNAVKPSEEASNGKLEAIGDKAVAEKEEIEKTIEAATKVQTTSNHSIEIIETPTISPQQTSSSNRAEEEIKNAFTNYNFIHIDVTPKGSSKRKIIPKLLNL